MADSPREQDLILAPGEYVFVLDKTKGVCTVLVGPYQSALSGNTVPVTWDGNGFVRHASYDRVIQRFVNVREGEYAELLNPSADSAKKHPAEGNSNNSVDLKIGSRVVIPGPACFAQWPRQSVNVIPGHRLRTNQYLMFRVCNDVEANANWATAIMKKAEVSKPVLAATQAGDSATASAPAEDVKPNSFVTGQLIIIRGTEFSFVIPPTGIEVVPDKNGNLVRDAITLERMEYCILLSEGGDQRFVHGPAVVFPSPTETFVEINADGRNQVKFKPIELNPHSGLHIKVVADHEEVQPDGSKVQRKAGDELFVTGATQPIYYPRMEHSTISYGDKMVHFAVAVPKGEGRYVLNRDTGEVALTKGPAMLLPDPRHFVLTRRVLDPKQAKLWYPGNTRVAEVNERLSESLRVAEPDHVASSYVASGDQGTRMLSAQSLVRGEERSSVAALQLGATKRPSSFSKPRTVTLDTKYDGAVHISPFPGYAVLVVDKVGSRRVVEGPETILLEYDETLVPMTLSTQTPKTDKATVETVYLQVSNNRVSDIVTVETGDLVSVQLKLAYRVNFEGESDAEKLRWFDVDNYVRFLTEHIRSLLRNVVKKQGIEAFYRNPIDIVRDAILGVSAEGKRPGRAFTENGMRVLEVDVLSIEIPDDNISRLLESAQMDALKSTLDVANKQRQLDKTQRIQAIDRQIATEISQTKLLELGHAMAEDAKRAEADTAKAKFESDTEKAEKEAEQALQTLIDVISQAELARQKAVSDHALAVDQARLDQHLAGEEAATEQLVKRAGAISADLIAALQSFSDTALIGKAAEAMGPLAIFRGTGVVDALAGLLAGTPLAATLQHLGSKKGNGQLAE